MEEAKFKVVSDFQRSTMPLNRQSTQVVTKFARHSPSGGLVKLIRSLDKSLKEEESVLLFAERLKNISSTAEYARLNPSQVVFSVFEKSTLIKNRNEKSHFK
eukprot:Blabericola_migrator_1__8638@NODE_452_length_8338_cov_76_789143_g354_i0_p6_GENE_NODE_452_length_8338_cov_76_789143_g354_i0NODE_452_length_8338_cov_76_789143_g354_i0_p6_ORF_typecomplete_len102_score4_48_NODE_452_length_8338_cov_76_789143_g354_i074857790